MTLSLKNSNKDFDFVGCVNLSNVLANLFSQCKVLLCERNTHDASSVGENCCSISAQKTTKKSFSRFVEKWTHRLYANEQLVRVRLAFQKLLQTRQTSRNVLSKQVLVMIKHCLGKSQINSIPAWSKQFSYITFLYRANAKVYAYN